MKHPARFRQGLKAAKNYNCSQHLKLDDQKHRVFFRPNVGEKPPEAKCCHMQGKKVVAIVSHFHHNGRSYTLNDNIK